ncbi:hypothetical protein ACFOLJ_00135 [Rugamonas sp. CCM 8940]|uniref:hypothetical protein n=1 Tax=Rugamonas sp. CCM 8940 TaxID=2765359 RepID=UPI00361B84FB
MNIRTAASCWSGNWRVGRSPPIAPAATTPWRSYRPPPRGQPYDVALLDMDLARTSGLALAASIKADAAIAAVRLLLLSSERGAPPTRCSGARPASPSS